MFERLDPTDGCSRATEAVAFVQRELDGADAARYAAHLDACVACREAVAEYRGLLCELGCDRDRALRELGDLPRVRVAPPARRLGVAAAAILVVAVSVWAIMDYHGVSSGAFVASGEPGTEALALDWFARTQGADGLWHSAEFGGDARFDVGVSALGLLAFLGAPSSEAPTSRGERQIDAAVSGIVDSQHSDGLFGKRFFGAPYNHGIATTALLELVALHPEYRDRVDAPLRRAVDWLLRAQARDGGWSYLDGEASNAATTYWPLRAILLAGALYDSHTDLGGSVDRAFAWLASVSDSHGNIAYRRSGVAGGPTLVAKAVICEGMRTLGGGSPTATGRRWIDRLAREALSGGAESSSYGDLLMLTALSYRAGATPGAERLRARAIERLNAALAPPATESGAATDRWSAFGGRLYTAATATLALQSERRHERLRGLLARG